MLDTHCIKGYLCKGKSERGFQHADHVGILFVYSTIKN